MKMPMQHELTGFFGSESVLADESVPWVYNHITFTAKAGADSTIFEVEPASGEVRLRWLQGDRQALELILDHVDSLTIDDREDALVVHFEERVGPGSLRLRLNPAVSLFWDARAT